MTGDTLRLEQCEKIGTGTFGLVYRARDIDTGRLVALKKSRASVSLKRTGLHYEARVLKRLGSHPSIPAVFAHGRFPHFEYLAIELLGDNLGDIVQEQGKLTLEYVLKVADQLISSLEHVHGQGIVHRDIKPENILLRTTQPLAVCLIDFGISRPFLAGTPQIQKPTIEHNYVVGTLPYASLNSHDGIDLNPRDDLESLAYTLLFLLKGSLPWQAHSECGTALGQIYQVREQKRRWKGSELSKHYPREFGWLVDYARGLKFTEHIPYARVQARFSGVRQMHTVSSKSKGPAADSSASRAPQCPVEIGQLVSVKILARTSIEGLSLQGLAEPWHNPFLSSKQFATSARPAIVIDTTFDKSTAVFAVQVVSVGKCTPVQPTNPAKGVSGHVAISTHHSHPPDREGTIVLQPAWSMLDTYCYAFPRAQWFYCLSNQKPTRAHWKIKHDNIEVLRRMFAKPFSMVISRTPIADPVLRYETRMDMQDVKLFVTLSTLKPSNINSKAMDWRGDRGFFDESIAIARQRGLEDGYFNWTGAPVQPVNATNSYDGDDYSMFNTPQQERAQELTFDFGHDGSLGDGDELGMIVQVI